MIRLFLSGRRLQLHREDAKSAKKRQGRKEGFAVVAMPGFWLRALRVFAVKLRMPVVDKTCDARFFLVPYVITGGSSHVETFFSVIGYSQARFVRAPKRPVPADHRSAGRPDPADNHYGHDRS